MRAEIRAWAQRHANVHITLIKDIVNMRWILRFKDTRQTIARFVREQLPRSRTGGEVRTGNKGFAFKDRTPTFVRFPCFTCVSHSSSSVRVVCDGTCDLLIECLLGSSVTRYSVAHEPILVVLHL